MVHLETAMWVLCTAAALGGARADSSSSSFSPVPFNFTFADYSPQLLYVPALDTDPGLAQGPPDQVWNATWSGSSWSTYQSNTIPKGDSNHVTSLKGASVSIAFEGTAVFFNGAFSDGGEVEFEVDGATSTHSGDGAGELASADGLTFGKHNATLRVQAGTVSISDVVVTYGLKEALADGADEHNPTAYMDYAINNGSNVGRGQPNSALVTDNCAWETNNYMGGASGTQQVPYYRVQCDKTYGRATLPLGSGNVFMELQGSTSFDHADYDIQLQASNSDANTDNIYRGFNPWAVINTTLYATNLDPDLSYSLSVVVRDSGPDGNWTDLSTVKLWKAEKADTGSGTGSGAGEAGSGSSSSNKSNTGAIAGGVVGGVLGAAVVGIAIWFFLRRRSKRPPPRKAPSPEHSRFEVDDAGADALTPYSEPHRMEMGHLGSGSYGAYPSSQGLMQQSVSSPTNLSRTDSSSYNPTYSSTMATPRSPPGHDTSPGLFGSQDGFFPSSTAPTSLAPAAAGHSEKSLRRQLPARPSVTQESDAGLLDDVIPPSYDPAWGDAAAARASSASTGFQSK